MRGDAARFVFGDEREARRDHLEASSRAPRARRIVGWSRAKDREARRRMQAPSRRRSSHRGIRRPTERGGHGRSRGDSTRHDAPRVGARSMRPVGAAISNQKDFALTAPQALALPHPTSERGPVFGGARPRRLGKMRWPNGSRARDRLAPLRASGGQTRRRPAPAPRIANRTCPRGRLPRAPGPCRRRRQPLGAPRQAASTPREEGLSLRRR